MKYLLLFISLLGTSATYSQSGKFASNLIASITDTLVKADAVEKSKNVVNNESIADAFSVSTLAGAGMPQLLNAPSGVAVDAQENVYVADAANNVIKKISNSGSVTTLAGCGTAGSTDGTTKASFYFPVGIAIDALGNVYVADKGNHKIRKISSEGVVTTLAGNGTRGAVDGMGKNASFDKPVAVAVDAAGNVFVADQCNHKIRKISPQGLVSTVAGNGQLGYRDGAADKASFYNPSGIAVDILGNLFVADYGNNRIRKITTNGEVATVTGSDTIGAADGAANHATFYFPDAIAVDASGNLFVSDQTNHKIRKISSGGLVSTIAGCGKPGADDGAGKMASFRYPAGIAVDQTGNVYVADYNNNKVRKIVANATELKNTDSNATALLLQNTPAH